MSKMQFLGLSKACVHTPAGKNYSVPESVKDVVEHLDNKRPTFTLLYFSAAWNPKCAEIEQDYENLIYKFGNWHHLRVDCDKAP
jgi:hypothetical protein